MNSRTKKITAIAALSAIAFVVMYLSKLLSIVIIPALPFLTYDPKDVVIALGGLIWGPIASLISSVIVAVIEMVTISTTGIIGAVMNIVSSCAFACTAALVYKKFRTIRGAIVALISGCVAQCALMLLWNYLVSPLYMGVPREAIAELLIPGFLPFNLIKSGLNAALTYLLYKPVVTALRRSGIAPESTINGKTSRHIGIIAVAALIIITCLMLILSMNGLV